MLNKLKEIRALNALAKKQSVGMQRKLMFYWGSMILVVFAAVFLLLSIAGVFSKDDKRLHEVLSLQLQNSDAAMSDWMNHLVGEGLYLSKTMGREIEEVLLEEGVSMEALNNQPDKLRNLQMALYPVLNTALQTCDCNGAYFILDATTNTLATKAAHSRSGVYLRYSNLSAASPVTPTVVYFRGIPDVARENALELHNRWNLEFDTTKMPGYEDMIQAKIKRPAELYFWSQRIQLMDTWESAMHLCIPIVGSDGSVYGICGFEIGALYFSFSFPAVNGPFGDVVTALAPLQNQQLLLGQGMVGGIKNSYLDGQESLLIHEERFYNSYEIDGERYIGLHQPMQLSKGGIQKVDWQLAVLIPEKSYAAYTVENRMIWMAMALLLLSVLLVAFFLSRRFVRPIIESLKALQQEETQSATQSSGISEIDELTAFLNARTRNQQLEKGELPPNIAELFDLFVARKQLLTEAENNILRYYIEGHEISEIPDLAFISMSTVRKHNRSIYRKLQVASRDELMLYIDLLRRCDRLDEIL